MVFILALSLFSFALAGCLAGGPQEASLDDEPGAEAEPSATAGHFDASPSGPSHRELSLSSKGNVLGPYSNHWSWQVEDAMFDSYAVTLWIGGYGPAESGGSGAFVDVEARLIDGSGTVVSEYLSNADAGGWGDVLQYHVARTHVAPGEWHLVFDTAGGVASYEVRVEGHYLIPAPTIASSDPAADASTP